MESLLELLDGLAKRPQMFVHPISFSTVQGFLEGLRAGLRFAGIEWTWSDYIAAAEARGWDSQSSKGLSDAEMIQELIAVETDAYARALARTKKHAELGATPDPAT